MLSQTLAQDLGLFVRRKRVDHAMRQVDLANKAGVGVRVISHIESGRSCDFHSWLSVMSALGCHEDLATMFPATIRDPRIQTSTTTRKRYRKSRNEQSPFSFAQQQETDLQAKRK